MRAEMDVFIRHVILPIWHDEMPPFSFQSVESGLAHTGFLKNKVRSDTWIGALITPHRGGREIVEVCRHGSLSLMRVDQGGVNRNAPTMERTVDGFGVGHIIVVAGGLPKLELHRRRTIRIPDF